MIGVKAARASGVEDYSLQEAEMSGQFDDDAPPSSGRPADKVSLPTWALMGCALVLVYVLALVLLHRAP